MQLLSELLDALPEDLRRQAFTHSSWTEKRTDSYERLAFLGDSVLGFAVTTHLYPRLDERSYGAGRLTKIRAQAVSRDACHSVAERLDLPRLLTENAPEGVGQSAATLVGTERVIASVCEAVIGACYLAFGYERTAEAVVEAFQPELSDALDKPVDFKSTLQERLARRGDAVVYNVMVEEGPAHERRFEVAACVNGRELARGTGRTKKSAEQEAARAALALGGS